jgi:DNA-binding transcriptional LysR family regulator
MLALAMAVDWNDLKVFLALERGGTARAAAQRLKVGHSTVLRRLQMLERALGATLFDRTPEGLLLTTTGARLLAKAEQIEADMFDVERDVLGADVRLQGPIRLTVPPPVAKYLLLPYLAQFRRDYPDIDLEVIATYGYSDLGRRDADIAIRFSGSPDDNLVGRPLPQFRDAIFAAPDYAASRFSVSGFPDAAWVGWPDVAGFSRRIAQTVFADIPVTWRLPGLELQAAAAREGMGMALLPCIMGDRDPGLVRVPGSTTYDTLPAWLLFHPDLRRMERVRVFARMIAAAIRSEAGFAGGTGTRGGLAG